MKDIIDRVFVGHLLHLLYVRGSWSDLAAVQNGEIDQDGKFFELSTQQQKGAKGQEAKSRLLGPLLSKHISAVSNPTAMYSRGLISAVMREFC